MRQLKKASRRHASSHAGGLLSFFSIFPYAQKVKAKEVSLEKMRNSKKLKIVFRCFLEYSAIIKPICKQRLLGKEN